MHTVLTCFITWLKVLLKVLVLIIAIYFFTGLLVLVLPILFLAWYWYWILQYFLPVLLTTLQ